jgi:hypothetical protein
MTGTQLYRFITRRHLRQCELRGLRSRVAQDSFLMGYDAALRGKRIPRFRPSLAATS